MGTHYINGEPVCAESFEWREVEGLGRCLVPKRIQATAEDVRHCRAFYGLNEELHRIVRVFPPRGMQDGRSFYTIVGSRYGQGQGYIDTSFHHPQDLADKINEASRTSRIRLVRWADEEGD